MIPNRSREQKSRRARPSQIAKRPHPVEPLDAGLAPALVSRKDNLGIGAGLEPAPGPLELAPQLDVVEHLAVVEELELAVLARERLPPAVGEVDDGESRMGEGDAGRLERALTVRSAVVELADHRARRLALGLAAE